MYIMYAMYTLCGLTSSGSVGGVLTENGKERAYREEKHNARVYSTTQRTALY